jgi:osmotically-inducible protein OsmY
MSSRNIRRLAAAIAGSAALAAGSAAALAAANTNSSPSDAQITQQVKQKLARDLPDSLMRVQVETQNGVVTLSGRATSGMAELKAMQDARRVPGVTDVKDKMSVTM